MRAPTWEYKHESQNCLTSSALAGIRVDLQLRALAAPEATAANSEGRRFPFPRPPGSGIGTTLGYI